MPPNPDVLDGVGQLLLIQRPASGPRPRLPRRLGVQRFVKFINRAKDELVTPDDFEAYVTRERAIFEDRYGSFADAGRRAWPLNGNLRPVREVRSDYARLRRNERGGRRQGDHLRPDAREGRRPRGPANDLGQRRGAAAHRFTPEQHDEIDQLAETYVDDGAALEVMRLAEIASVYRAYQEELAAARRPRLRREDRRSQHAVQASAEHPAPMAAPVPLPPGRRVPGRQPGSLPRSRARRAGCRDAGVAAGLLPQ